MKKNILLVGCFVATLIIFQFTYGLVALVPTNVSWLMSARGDWGTHYLGWFFYRNEPWHFPLGNIHRYFYPLGTNVAFTDSIPLMAIFFKLFSGLLPGDFQYFGIWLLSCDLLIAWYTIRLLRLFGLRPFYIFLAVILLVANPVLVFRGMHPALCSHWLILGCFYCYFKQPGNGAVRGILREQFVLLLLSALINPYMCCLVLAFAIILPWRLYFFDKAIRARVGGLYTGMVLFSLLAVWWIEGMITFGKKEDFNGEGYGLYSLNLNALYNSFSWSSIFPTPKLVSWHQYEGYMYLGAGVFLLILVLMVYRVYRSLRSSEAPEMGVAGESSYRPNLVFLLVLVVLFTAFSLTNVISINDKVLLRIPLGTDGMKLANIFRASARFFWMPFYLLLLYVLVAISKMRLPAGAISAVFVLALLLQLYDTHRLLADRRMAHGAYTPPLDKHWSDLMAATDAVAFYPPFEASYLKPLDYQDFSFLAARLQKPLNIGYVARSDHRRMSAYIDSLMTSLQEAGASGALYITTPEHVGLFTNVVLEKRLCLHMLDGYVYLYAPDSVNNKTIDAQSDALDAKAALALDSVRRSIQPNVYVEGGANRPMDQLERGELKFNFERMIKGSKYLACSGWGFIQHTTTNKGDSIFSVLLSDRKTYTGLTRIEKRPDITGAFKADLDDAGFNGVNLTTFVDSGVYKIGLGIKNEGGKIEYALTDSVLRIDGKLHVVR
jgi:hypothetical protein